MLQQILIGIVAIALTIAAQVAFFEAATFTLTRIAGALTAAAWVRIAATVGVCLWLVLGAFAGALVWAAVFLSLGIFASIEAAVYFSLVTFTTLGYGDLTLAGEWRLLSGFAAMNGLIVFGLATAFVVAFIARVRVFR